MGEPKPRSWLVGLAFAIMCLVWGSTWMMIKIGLRNAPPLTPLGIRFLIAFVLIWAVIAMRNKRVPRTRSFVLLGLFLGAFHLAVPYALVYWAEQHITSGLTAVLYSTMPLAVALLARVHLGDPLTRSKIVGIAVGIAGVAFIYSDSLGWSGRLGSAGVLAVLASVFFASLSSVVLKKRGRGYDSTVLLLVPFFVSGMAITCLGVATESSNPLHYDSATWGTILYLAVLGSGVTFTLYFWVIQRLDVTVLSYQTFLIPIIALLFGWLFLGETVAPRVVAGTVLILTGIALATLPKLRRKHRPVPGTEPHGAPAREMR